MRFLVRQLAAVPLAAIDLEDFVDFTQVRPVVRLSAEASGPSAGRGARSGSGSRPRPGQGCCCFAAWSPSGGGAPTRQRSWRLPRSWRAADRVAGSDVSGPAPYPAPTRHGQQHRPHWHAQLEAWGMARRSRLRRPDGYCQRDVGRGAAPRHSVADLHGPIPHYLQGTTNPAMRQALLTTVAACSTWSWMCPPSMRPYRPFGCLRPGGGAGRRDPDLCAAA